MGLCLRRRVRIAPSLRANISKSTFSWSVGKGGLGPPSGPRGHPAVVGWPGGGLPLTQQWGPAGLRSGRNTRVTWFWIAVLALLVALGTLSHVRADQLDWKPEIIDGLSMRCATSPVEEKTIIASSEAVGDTTTVYNQTEAKGVVYMLQHGKAGAHEDPIGDMVAMHQPNGVVLAFAFARGFCIWEQRSSEAAFARFMEMVRSLPPLP
jgi:hypothetical protein